MPVATEYTDYRQKWLLHPGDAIQCNDTIYTISGPPLGFGGSAVLYPAAKNGSALFYAIKEGFPGGSEHFGRRNGIIQPLDPEDDFSFAQLEQYRSMLSKERELGQQIRNTSTRAIAIWDTLTPTAVTTGGETFTNVSNGIFSVLERMNGKGMFFNEFLEAIKNSYSPEDLRRTQGLPQIYTTSRIMEQVLLALHRVHQAGYLYGDCSPSNIFFSECDPKSGNAGIGHLIDFGSARELEEDGYTAPITKGDVFSTDGFRPFEIRDNKDGFLRFGKQADVYSAGCLMLRCVVSPQKLKTYGDSPCAGSNALSEVNGRAINCTGRVLQLLNAILDKATKYDPKDRYADAGEMLKAVQELKKLTEPPKYLLPKNMSSPDYFVPHSRDRELAVLAKDVKEGKPVFIWGLGGIGKTEVAIALVDQLKPTKGAYLIHFRDSMRETILKLDFSGYRFAPIDKRMDPEEREEAEYQERLSILRDCYMGAVLIIDNFDYEGKTLADLRRESAYRDMIGLGIQLIFTTCYPIERKEWKIRELSEDDLMDLMRFYCRPVTYSDAQLLPLIHAVNGHT